MSFITLLALLLVALVAGLGWMLFVQRRQVLAAEGMLIDRGTGPADLALLAVERLAGLNVTKGEDQMDARMDAAVPAQAGDGTEALFPITEAQDLRRRWDAIQASFVDEPHRAVEEADRLVAGAVKRLSDSFAVERQSLEAQRARGSDISTEDLRLALRRYKSYFSRLLSV